MGILFYGVKKAAIGIDEILSYCPSCETDTFADIYITSDYYHFYFVPIFPIEKEVTFSCKKCGLLRKDIPLTKNSVKNFDEVNRKFKHPWYTYFAMLFIAVIILIAVFLS
jgi:hypothetical protein